MARSVTIQEAAEEMSVCMDKVRDLIDEGELKGHRVGRAVRVYLDSISDYQRRNEIAPRTIATPKRTRKIATAHLQAMDELTRLGI